MNVDEATDTVWNEVSEYGHGYDKSDIRRHIEGELELFDMSVKQAAQNVKEGAIQDAERPKTVFGKKQDAETNAEEDDVETDIGDIESTVGTGISTDMDEPAQPVQTVRIRGQPVTVDAKVVSLWDLDIGKLAQRGIIADSTGWVIFSIWEDSNQKPVELGETYRFATAISAKQGGEPIINVTPLSSVTEIHKEIETPDSDIVADLGVEGAAIKVIEDGSGIITRCPEPGCSRAVTGYTCNRHGTVKGGETDLRLKVLVDDSNETNRLIFGKSQTEHLLGMSLDEAETVVEEAGSGTPIIDQVRSALIGTQIRALGIPFQGNLMVGWFEQTPLSDVHDLPSVEPTAART